MVSNGNEIPGIEIISPTIYSAKSAAREYIDGNDFRSPVNLLRDLAMAYVARPGASTREESHIGAFGRDKPRINPWGNDYMRVKQIHEVAFDTERGPTGIILSEQSDVFRRQFKPAIRRLGAFAFRETEATSPISLNRLVLSRPDAEGDNRYTQLLLDPWAEINGSVAFTDWVYAPYLEEMLAFPDEPTVITPFPSELRSK